MLHHLYVASEHPDSATQIEGETSNHFFPAYI